MQRDFSIDSVKSMSNTYGYIAHIFNLWVTILFPALTHIAT